MHSVSDLFLQILSGPHTVDRALQIGGTGPVENCTEIPGTVFYTDGCISMDTKSAVLGREAPSIGECVSSKLTASILKAGNNTWSMARAVPFVRVRNADGESEWIPKGVFYVDTSKKRRSGFNDITTELAAYDVFMLAEADYVPGDGIAWPSNAAIVAADIAAQLGTTLEPATAAALQEYKIDKPEDGKYSQKEMLGYIAAMHGGSMVSDDYGRLKIIRLAAITKEPDIVLKAQGNRLRIGDELAGITGIELHHGDGNKDTAGDAAGTMLAAEIPWATQEMAESILDQAAGYSYIPYEVKKTIINPLVELGDVVVMPHGKKEYVYELNINFLSKLVASIGAPEVKALNHEAKYQSKAERAGARAVAAVKDDVTKVKSMFTSLEATVDEVSAGVYAVATKSELDKAREAGVTLYAAINGDIADRAKIAQLGLYSISDGDGNIKTLAQIVAELTKIIGDVEVQGKVIILNPDGSVGVATSGSILSGGNISLAGNMYFTDANAIIYIGADAFAKQTITSIDGHTFGVVGHV